MQKNNGLRNGNNEKKRDVSGMQTARPLNNNDYLTNKSVNENKMTSAANEPKKKDSMTPDSNKCYKNTKNNKWK